MGNIGSMATFAIVVERGSFTAAAEALGMSKSVVSKQVSQLERALNVTLLNRTTRQLNLTEAGSVFYEHCRRIVAEGREAEAAVLPLQTEPCGTLRITAPQCLAITMLARLLPEFQQRWPRVQLEVSVTGRMTDLVAEGLDLGLRIGELADSSLLARRIGSAPFIVCASPRYWSRHGRPEHPRQLIDHNCLIYLEMANHDQWAFEQPDGTAIRIPVSGNLRSDDASLLMRSAIADQGVMIGPQFMFAAAMAAGQLEVVLDAYCRRGIGVYAVYPNSKRVAPKVRAFIDFLAASPEW